MRAHRFNSRHRAQTSSASAPLANGARPRAAARARACHVLPLLGILVAACGDGEPDTLAQANAVSDSDGRAPRKPADAGVSEVAPESTDSPDEAPSHGHGPLDAGTREDAAEPPDGAEYLQCAGRPYGTGSCELGQICAAMPNVPFKYCMPRPPCPDGMVEVMNVACAYPCEQSGDCEKHRLPHCAPNDLVDFTGGARGWCTP